MIDQQNKPAQRVLGIERLIRKVLQFIARKAPFISGHWRVYIHRWRGVRFSDPKTCFVGEDVYFDDLYPELIRVGRNVIITEGAKILSHFLEVDQMSGCLRFYQGEVIIGDDVFIGTNVVISKPVTIGEGAVLGAGSVITRNVPPYVIMGGAPAKEIGKRRRLEDGTTPFG